jgi:transcription elongation factor GreA
MFDNIYLTQEGIDKLTAELENLKGPVRQELAAKLKAAIEMGDLSENADYKKAKEDQGFIEGRIQELEETLKRAQVIEQNTVASGMIQIGSTVIVKEEGYSEEEFQIVGSKETDPNSGKISYESPIGSALLNRRVGDIVRVKTPEGGINFKIIEIK